MSVKPICNINNNCEVTFAREPRTSERSSANHQRFAARPIHLLYLSKMPKRKATPATLPADTRNELLL